MRIKGYGIGDPAVKTGIIAGASIGTAFALPKALDKIEQLAGKYGKIAKWGILLATLGASLYAAIKMHAEANAAGVGVLTGTIPAVLKELGVSI